MIDFARDPRTRLSRPEDSDDNVVGVPAALGRRGDGRATRGRRLMESPRSEETWARTGRFGSTPGTSGRGGPSRAPHLHLHTPLADRVRTRPLALPVARGDGRDLPGAGSGIDVTPVSLCRSGVQNVSAEYGCTGPIVGVMGADSWRGFARALNNDRWG